MIRALSNYSLNQKDIELYNRINDISFSYSVKNSDYCAFSALL